MKICKRITQTREREREHALLKLQTAILAQQLLKGKTLPLLVPVMLCLSVSLHLAANSGLPPETSRLKGRNLLVLLKPLHLKSQGFRGAVARSTRSRRPFGLRKRPAHIYACLAVGPIHPSAIQTIHLNIWGFEFVILRAAVGSLVRFSKARFGIGMYC